MRSPYQSPAAPPATRFLRRRPPENPERRKAFLVLALLAASFLVYTFVLSDSGLVRIHSLRR
jgi:hypothetical protein